MAGHQQRFDYNPYIQLADKDAYGLKQPFQGCT